MFDKESEIDATLNQWRSHTIHDADFEAFQQISQPVKCVLDVGANRGQSIASFRMMFRDAAIHSFEANPLLHEVLDSVAMAIPGPNMIHHYGLGNAESIVPLYVPFSGAQPYLEEATTRLDYFDQPWVVEKFRQRGGMSVQRLDAQLRIGDSLRLAPEVIKVDVEGAEHRVLVGLHATIESNRPILLIENSDYQNVTNFLSSLGYRPFRYDQSARTLVDFYGETTNTFYIHGDAC